MVKTKEDLSTEITPRGLLTGDEVAKSLNISRTYAYLLMRRGEIPTVHLGRSVRVRSADLENYISSNISRDEVLWAQL